MRDYSMNTLGIRTSDIQKVDESESGIQISASQMPSSIMKSGPVFRLPFELRT